MVIVEVVTTSTSTRAEMDLLAGELQELVEQGEGQVVAGADTTSTSTTTSPTSSSSSKSESFSLPCPSCPVVPAPRQPDEHPGVPRADGAAHLHLPVRRRPPGVRALQRQAACHHLQVNTTTTLPDPVHLSTCPPFHLSTCTPVHLYTFPPVQH